jgi:hypothetical protein
MLSACAANDNCDNYIRKKCVANKTPISCVPAMRMIIISSVAMLSDDSPECLPGHNWQITTVICLPGVPIPSDASIPRYESRSGCSHESQQPVQEYCSLLAWHVDNTCQYCHTAFSDNTYNDHKCMCCHNALYQVWQYLPTLLPQSSTGLTPLKTW